MTVMKFYAWGRGRKYDKHGHDGVALEVGDILVQNQHSEYLLDSPITIDRVTDIYAFSGDKKFKREVGDSYYESEVKENKWYNADYCPGKDDWNRYYTVLTPFTEKEMKKENTRIKERAKEEARIWEKSRKEEAKRDKLFMEEKIDSAKEMLTDLLANLDTLDAGKFVNLYPYLVQATEKRKD